jgi:hypothetical protein
MARAIRQYDISSDAIQIAKEREKERLDFKSENFLDTDNMRFIIDDGCI